MIVSILGCGWYGRALASKLLEENIKVKGSVTSDLKVKDLKNLGISPYLVSFNEYDHAYEPDFFKCDVLVISIPPGFKKGKGTHYPSIIRGIIDTIAAHDVTKVIYISSTGVYGDRNKEVVETDDPEPDSESGEILLQAEKLFERENKIKTTIVRFGGLVGPGRNPARFFSGKINIPNGRAPINLIHQADCVGVTEAIINADLFGVTVNACAPDHMGKADFYCKLARHAKLPVPQFIDELKKWKIVNSIYLIEKLDYHFSIKSWDAYPENELT